MTAVKQEEFEKGSVVLRAPPGEMSKILTTLCFIFVAGCAIFLTTSTASARSCGGLNARPCKIWERIPSCNKGLVESFAQGKCVRPGSGSVRPGVDCGALNKRPCKLWERVPSCNKGLVESFAKGLCLKPAVAGVDCGNVNQRPCKVWERIPSCNENLKEDFAKGLCVAVSCGKENGRPCTIVERIPSCDKGLVEDFLKNRCVKSANRQKEELATKKMAELTHVIIAQMSFANRVARDPGVRSALSSDNPDKVARSASGVPPGAIKLPTGGDLRTLTIGASVGAKVIIGGSAGAGAAIDLTGRLPVHAYATADYDISLGFGGAAGVDVGFWTCQVNKIGGDSWAMQFGPKDLFAAARLLKGSEGASVASMAKAGPDMGVAMWFGYDNVFQGFTLTPGVSAGIDFGGISWATTAVKDDPSVDCKGNPENGNTVAPPPSNGLIPPPFLQHRTFIQDIKYSAGSRSGTVRHWKVDGGAKNSSITRVCLVNETNNPKVLAHHVRGVNNMSAPDKGSQSCANLSSSMRFVFQFTDRGTNVRSDAMNLSAYAGDIVIFQWLAD